MKKLTEEKFQELIMEQFKISGIEWVTFKDLQADEKWLEKYTTTELKNEKWTKYLRKELKPYTLWWYRLEKEVQMFNLSYWLRIRPWR